MPASQACILPLDHQGQAVKVSRRSKRREKKSFGEEIFDSGIRVREEIQARSLPAAVLRLNADSHSKPGSEKVAEQAAGGPALALSVTDSTRPVIQSQAVKKWQNRLLQARHLHFQ